MGGDLSPQGIVSRGIRYQNSYGSHFRVKGGLITEWVEYFDLQETMAVAAAMA
jgi:ketosteroid isomerase-like protein